MKQSIYFSPAVDPLAAVISAVLRAYGETNFTIAELLDPTINIGGVKLELLTDPNVNTAVLGASVSQAATALVTPAATATTGSVELDTTGVPWDPRIHSDAAERKTAKGVWKKRKGVDDLTCSTVHNELLAMMAAKVGTTAAAPTALPVGGVLGNPTNVAHQTAVEVSPNQFVVETALAAPLTMAALETPLAAPAALAPLAAITAAPAEPSTFPELMNYLSPLLTDGTLDQRHIDHVCGHFKLVDAQGIAQIALAQSRPDLIKVLYQSFKAQADAVKGA
jgi:hypothetical protein